MASDVVPGRREPPNQTAREREGIRRTRDPVDRHTEGRTDGESGLCGSPLTTGTRWHLIKNVYRETLMLTGPCQSIGSAAPGR